MKNKIKQIVFCFFIFLIFKGELFCGIKGNTFELEEKLSSKVKINLKERSFFKILKDISLKYKIPIRFSEGIKDKNVFLKKEYNSLRDLLDDLSLKSGYALMSGYYSIFVLNDDDVKEIRKREKVLSVAQNGTKEEKEKLYEELLKEYFSNEYYLNEKQNSFYLRYFTYLGLYNKLVVDFFNRINAIDSDEKAVALFENMLLFVNVLNALEKGKNGILENRYYLSGKRYEVHIDNELVKSAKEKICFLTKSYLKKENEYYVFEALKLIYLSCSEGKALLENYLKKRKLKNKVIIVFAVFDENVDINKLKDIVEEGSKMEKVIAIKLLFMKGIKDYFFDLLKLYENGLRGLVKRDAIDAFGYSGKKEAFDILLNELLGDYPDNALKSLEILTGKTHSKNYILKGNKTTQIKVYKIWKNLRKRGKFFKQ